MAEKAETQRAEHKLRREQRRRRALSLISWSLTLSSVGGLFGIYHMLSLATAAKADGLLRPAADRQGETRITHPAVMRTTEPSAEANQRAKPQTPDTNPALLQPGSYGPAVLQLQEELAALGLFRYGSFTAFYGPVTERAVRRFQALTGLPVTGIADSVTRKLIAEAVHMSGTQVPPAAPPAVGNEATPASGAAPANKDNNTTPSPGTSSASAPSWGPPAGAPDIITRGS
ncbi:hypothetical protein GCM10010885_20650 [Alicyclobacillus cellulosilyticus]|uniref:Peptidoglycan binding-like domain-containing protein n=1 Tax=Alicyclobacillus cellulosilyticus TaxID=1003997 RepID=A0A917KEH8_9BACL|nr:peptidoglycan-binding domain-containing protein [Alicyclobacillus cellulosilyticus]GGJ11214.1 hypothetical protein GCM10010885_20650 [Alicyclobacillus cellulosilyticus]